VAHLSRRWHYRAYGLTVGSDVELPELPDQDRPAREAEPRVQVTLASPAEIAPSRQWFRTCELPNGEPFLSCAKVDDGYILRYEGLADFFVAHDGSEIRCVRPHPGIEPSTLRHLLLDQAFPMALSAAGREVLHATAVATPYGACAFVGPTGSGKSTMAAAFLDRGCPALADDCLVLEERERVFATPAYPGLRLWRDAFEALSRDSDRSMAVAGYTSKTRLLGPRAIGNFPAAPVPLAGVYRLMREDSSGATAARIVPIAARDALVELVSCSFLLDTTDRSALARQFRFLGRLVTRVPVRKLIVPNDFSKLPAAYTAVMADLEAAACATAALSPP
jgi:hypothetical protein